MPELTWSGKDDAKKSLEEIPQRLLDFDSSLSYGDDSQNIIVHGDNLHVLKSLLPLYRSAVKCIYIDPPYNTGSAFDHYKDNFPHSDWLNLMLPRLILLKDFLADDGSIWISIDDDEAHYLKVLCDEIFDRNNFVASVIWQKRGSRSNDAHYFCNNHDCILVYAKYKDILKINKVPRLEEIPKGYSNPDNDPRGLWTSTSISAPTESESCNYPITSPSGKIFYPPAGRHWAYSKKNFEKLLADDRIYFGNNGKNVPRKKTFLSEVQGGLVPFTIWLRTEVDDTQDAKKEILRLFGDENIFDTPKPERLIQRILTLATNEGDMVLDAYLGSGTTAAVAHKMKRRYIGIEIGEQIITHVVPRLKKVIDGEVGGISKIENWTGGGGYKFYRLGGTIIDKDGTLNSAVTEKDLASLIWFKATKSPYRDEKTLPLIGVHNGAAYYLVKNLTRGTFMNLPQHDGEKIIYGDVCKVGENFLRENKITFKQIPKALEE